MKFQVAGHYRGKRIKTATVEASSKEDAESKAKGIEVESVWPLDDLAESGWGEVVEATSIAPAAAPPPLPKEPRFASAIEPPPPPAAPPSYGDDPGAAIFSRLLAIEHHLKRSNERLMQILICVFLLALPMILAIVCFLLMTAGLIGTANRLSQD